MIGYLALLVHLSDVWCSRSFSVVPSINRYSNVPYFLGVYRSVLCSYHQMSFYRDFSLIQLIETDMRQLVWLFFVVCSFDIIRTFVKQINDTTIMMKYTFHIQIRSRSLLIDKMLASTYTVWLVLYNIAKINNLKRLSVFECQRNDWIRIPPRNVSIPVRSFMKLSD